MQFGPSPRAQEYCCQSPCQIPPAQWGDHDAREAEAEECELFGDQPATEDDPAQVDLEQQMAHQDELDIAAVPSPSNGRASNVSGPLYVLNHQVMMLPPRHVMGSVSASGRVRLGKAKPPCFGTRPGTSQVPSRRLPSPPPPPSSSCSSKQPMQPSIHSSGRSYIPGPSPQEEVHQTDPEMEAMGQEEEIQIIQPAMHTPEEEVQVPIPQEEESCQPELHPMAIQAMAVQLHLHHFQVPQLQNKQEEQVSQAAIQYLRQHLQLHLQDSIPSTCGHRWTGQGSPSKAIATFELQELQHFGHAVDARSLV